MKIIIIFIFFISLFTISCSKENNAQQKAFSSNNIIARSDTARIPINDLGSGTFDGYVGGLYPNGANTPTGTYAIDLYKTCLKLAPIDTFGNPSPKKGNISFVALGWSIGHHNLEVLKEKTYGNPLTNPKLVLEDLTIGSGKARLNDVLNPNDTLWTFVAQRLKNLKSSFRQEQIVYLDTEDSNVVTSFPARPLLVKKDLQTCFRTIQQKFPNLKLVYLLGRQPTYQKPHSFVFNVEPCPYYFSWACKWAIEDQIKGVPGTEYKGVNKVSPIITWGFYDWATPTPRTTDGFKWTENLTSSDGLHPTDEGYDTLMTRFQNFLLTDSAAKQWYAR